MKQTDLTISKKQLTTRKRTDGKNYEVGWGVPEEELDLMYSFCPECGQRMDWEG